jgi:two-component system, NtrC family, sensor kinase
MIRNPKIWFLLFYALSFENNGRAQERNFPDSMRIVLANATTDSQRHEAFRLLYHYYEETNRDSALYYADQRLILSKRNNKKVNEAFSLGVKAYQLIYLGRFGEALSCLLGAFRIAEDPKYDEKDVWRVATFPSPDHPRLLTLSLAHHMFGHLMLRTGNIERQIFHFQQGRKIAISIGNHFRVLVADMMLGSSYNELGNTDSALIYATEALQMAELSGVNRYNGYINFLFGDVYLMRGDKVLALRYYQKALAASIEHNNQTTEAGSYSRLIAFYKLENNYDSVLYYAIRNLKVVRSMGAITAASGLEINIGSAYQNVYDGYKSKGLLDSAYKYQGLALVANDSIYKTRIKNLAEFQKLNLDEQQRLQESEKEKINYKNRVRTYLMLGGIGVLLLLAVIFYRNNTQKQKANALLLEEKRKVEAALQDLKTTQAQLIQSEKMASLGELTAGIAHEIQNPLNFVNNFSELNKELAEELKSELATGNMQSASEIADDIIENAEKINHHGKRADSIVKGMLQHSRSSSGQKEPTDINALTDEYLRLAYHGLRAKDKTFNATISTDFDTTVGSINIISQDIGRVILNLITNAFYAVNEKKNLGHQSKGKEKYEPTVEVTTRRMNGKVEIKVKDNGNGIPPNALDKIFQPFFTTKPTGQGTGLGLSLSYDIVRTHSGELKVNTREGEGTEFTILLPVT